MSCFVTIVLVTVARVAILLWWLADKRLFNLAFDGWTLPGIAVPVWVWTLLGGIFIPWTTLAYLFLFPGGVVGYEWIVLGVAFLVDLAGHGGSYSHRHRVLRYRRD